MTVDDSGENIREIAERIDVVEFTGLDQPCDGGPVVGAAVRASEQSIFPLQRDRRMERSTVCNSGLEAAFAPLLQPALSARAPAWADPGGGVLGPCAASVLC